MEPKNTQPNAVPPGILLYQIGIGHYFFAPSHSRRNWALPICSRTARAAMTTSRRQPRRTGHHSIV